ncbi:MAG: LLM class flavin-dependent oxidoreductase [Solirubrobacterales bacterium]
MSAPRIGVRWDPRWRPEELLEIAPLVEELGYDELWLIEDCFSSGGLTTASVALAITERLRIGIGLLPAPVRNPAIAAMEIATLARTFPGRFSPAFGHGVPDWMRQIDAYPEARMALLGETVDAIRRLVNGERLDVDGRYVKLDGVELEHKPEVPPQILIGTTGPRGLELAGRVSDGAVVPEVACPAAVRWAGERIAAGGDASELVLYSYLSLDEDDGVEVAVELVDQWIRSGVFPDMAEHAGLTRDGEGEISEEMLLSIATAGTPESCAATVQGLIGAGATSVVLLPREADYLNQLRRFAAEVLPGLREMPAAQ